MKNKKMLWIGLGVVAVVGYFWWMNKKKSSNATTDNAMDTDVVATDMTADATTDATATNFTDDELLNATGSTRQVKGRFP
jgi:flagellar basal body-associated protein FliL